jgi:anti-sigma B factor antagonist
MPGVQVLPTESGRQPALSIRPFAIDASQEGGTYFIRVQGELDLDQCPRLDRALEVAESSRSSRILLDLQGLTVIDGAGLHVLCTACKRSASNGDRLRVTRGRGNVAEMFRLTALDVTLPFTSLRA